MHKIVPFDFDSQEVRVVVDGDGEYFFVAKDVCDVLGYSDVSMTLEKLDEDEKLIRNFFSSGQDRDMHCIAESGLYTLIMHSNKEAVKVFKHWITHRVIPSIRKSGRYSVREEECLS